MDTVNTALTSYGMSGLVFHGPLLEEHNGFEIRKILERHNNKSKGKHPGAQLVRKYEDILVDPDIELVIVNTPDHLHYEMTMKALDHGKHVIVEKPFTLKTSHAEKIINKASSKQLMVSVFQNRRWDGDFMTVKKVMGDGQLGRLVSFESHFDRFRNYVQKSWKEDKSLGAGTLYNLGSHMIDQALQLFGIPEFIFADVRAMRTNSNVDDSFDITMYYDHVKCLVRGSYLVKEQGPRYMLHGTNGSFVKYGIDPQEEMLKAGHLPGSPNWGIDQPGLYGILNTDFNGRESREQVPTIPGNYMAYYDNIYDHLRHGSDLAVQPEEARDVVRIIEAAYESSEKKKVINL
ncbi:MAG: Gfo/Idh/MocA family oxidoreductase [Bacteroidales bacterium]|nr:Gfo/Idh/MocA family oxidoreductase [Bacteroidales bacterium]